MAEEPRTTVTLELQRTNTPAQSMPLGMIDDVIKVLEFHGLRADVADVLAALADVIKRTPAQRGGRRTDEVGVSV